MEIGGIFIFQNNMYFFFFAFAILGGGIKFVDDAFDEKTFSKEIGTFVAPILGALWAYTSLSNEVAGTILLAILVGVLFKGKIDNLAHKIGFVTIIAFLILAGTKLMIIPLIVLSISGIIDEVGNDIMDRKVETLKKNGLPGKFVMYFFEYRNTMKVAVLALTILGFIPLYFFVAFLLFDGAYHLIHLYSESREEIPVHKSHFELE